MAEVSPPMSVERLTQAINAGQVDTVLVACTDVLGRLQGKRVNARHFIDDVLSRGTEVAEDLLGSDVEMTPVDGPSTSRADRDYGDLLLRPDLSTLRPVTWQSGTAMVQCDLLHPDGALVPTSPRQVLMAQADRAADLGFVAYARTGVDFVLFDETYETAWDGAYQNLHPVNRYNVDYSLYGGGRVETLLREIRQHLDRAGVLIDEVRGSDGPGQHRMSFVEADAITLADQHVVFKYAAKEMAARYGKAMTFMARYGPANASACDVQLLLRGLSGEPVFAHRGDVGLGRGRSRIFGSFTAGVLATMREFALLYAPNVNSYKRFRPAGVAPTAIAWGEGNRTCAVRTVGRGSNLRLENQVPGADANLYLVLAAMLAGGLWGVEMELPLEPALSGNAQLAERARVPMTLREARDAFANSVLARNAFGDDVVDHYVDLADGELLAFECAVTDWERRRSFERT